jgi:lysophospholipase L1-like esterase
VRGRWLISLLIAASAALQAGMVSASPDRLPTPGRPWFLVVGDSISAGYTVDPGYDGAHNAWPEQVRQRLAASGTPWEDWSVACPGETTASYRDGGCTGRALVPALEGRSQRDAVADAIHQRGDSLRFMVVELGVNDLFRARTRGGRIEPQLDAAAARLDALVSDLQRLAPGVPLVLADIYDPHGLASSWAQSVHLDARIQAIAARHGAAVADFLHAIDRPLALPGDRCQLIDCAHHDVHPTLAGQTALAAAVLAALPAGIS